MNTHSNSWSQGPPHWATLAWTPGLPEPLSLGLGQFTPESCPLVWVSSPLSHVLCIGVHSHPSSTMKRYSKTSCLIPQFKITVWDTPKDSIHVIIRAPSWRRKSSTGLLEGSLLIGHAYGWARVAPS